MLSQIDSQHLVVCTVQLYKQNKGNLHTGFLTSYILVLNLMILTGNKTCYHLFTTCERWAKLVLCAQIMDGDLGIDSMVNY